MLLTTATRMRSAVIAILVLFATLMAPPSHAAQCPSRNINAPDVTTLMASTTNPATEAWVVTPKCEVEMVAVAPIGSASSVQLTLNALKNVRAIERVISIPSEITTLELSHHPLSEGIDLSSSSKLTFLVLYQSGGRTLSISFPPSLETLWLWDGILETMEGLVIPDTLSTFTCESCGLTSVQGARWPRSLRTVAITGNPITSFEIRETDKSLFRNLESFFVTITETGCNHPKAVPSTLSGKQLCVIPDAIFDELYPKNKSPDPASTNRPPDSTSSTSGSGSGTSSGNANTPSGSTNDDPDEDSSGSSRTRPSNSSTSLTDMTGSEQNPRKQDKSDGSVITNDTASSQNSTLLIAVVALSGVLAALVVVIGYRVFAAKRRKPDHADRSKYDQTSTPVGNTIDPDNYIGGNDSSGKGHSSTQEYLTNDVRNDKSLLPYRIERREVQLGKVIARGGFGLVYRGKYDGRDVAIKQMLPDAWRDDRMLASFMDEIRLCASLDHPKIVQFVGITWSSLRDLSVLTEFMTGGDLYDLLYQPANGPRPQDWSQPWSTMTASNLKCKTQMALDMAEAVVYLHSFESPIIHRDLKSKNVLLDGRGNAKLSDFGISRELVVDETMTSEIGTSAWIAPEVLRGERYSEKADVYSLGVVLVELDRCCHPYDGEPMLAAPQMSLRDGRRGASSNSVVSKATQIAVLVSTGRLRPSMSLDAPPLMRSLVDQCLVNNPEDRLNSMEVCYELRRILRSMKA